MKSWVNEMVKSAKVIRVCMSINFEEPLSFWKSLQVCRRRNPNASTVLRLKPYESYRQHLTQADHLAARLQAVPHPSSTRGQNE